MCRISGFWDLKDARDYDMRGVISSMNNTLAHGGPDDEGIYLDNRFNLAFGHRRLSVIDLSSHAHQPMCNDNESIWITYNGEVYNFHEIKEELGLHGHKFKSNSDTEVVLKAYEQWGIEAIHKFRGMFAFALWNKQTESLILVRDRAGVKPLYYCLHNGVFIFASELKAFHKHHKFIKKIDKGSLSLFLQFGFINAPYSIFENVYKLRPGHYIEVNKHGHIKDTKYWDIENHYLKGLELKESGYWDKRPEDEISDELENILTDAFTLRLISDVPIGVFLSGGIDSSLVTAILQKNSSQRIKTFTIGFDESYFNEAPWAKKVAKYLGTDHTEMYCSPQNAVDIVSKIPDLYDEPFGDRSAIPTHIVSMLAKEKVKVALSADGGDELFCGYSRYPAFKDRVDHLLAAPLVRFFSKGLGLIRPSLIYNFYNSLTQHFQRYTRQCNWLITLRDINNISRQFRNTHSLYFQEEVRKLGIEENYTVEAFENTFNRQESLITYMMIADFKGYMADDILVKVDRATMGVALEGREPMLDHKIVEYAAALPDKFKTRNGNNKYILKKILSRYIPEKMFERPKHGFGIPVHEWMKTEWKDLSMYYFNESRLNKAGIFDCKEVSNIVDKFFNHNDKNFNPYKLWFLLMFEMWYEKWM